MPTSRYVGTFVNPSIGTLIFEGNASALVVRFGDSWGLARTVAGPDGATARDAIAASVLGGDMRFALKFGEEGAVSEVTVRNFAFTRVR